MVEILELKLPFSLPAPVWGFDAKDFETGQGARRHLEHFKEKARAVFGQRNRLDLAGFVWGAGVPGYAGGPTVIMTRCEGMDEASKSQFANFVAHLCKSTEACAVAVASEIWMAKGATQDELQAWTREHDSLEHFPGRRELLMVQWDCVRFTEMWVSEITEVGGRRALGPWELMPRDASMGGRFAGLLKPMKERAS